VYGAGFTHLIYLRRPASPPLVLDGGFCDPFHSSFTFETALDRTRHFRFLSRLRPLFSKIGTLTPGEDNPPFFFRLSEIATFSLGAGYTYRLQPSASFFVATLQYLEFFYFIYQEPFV